MARCDKCRKTLMDDYDRDHVFCGYGYCVDFCAKCCPREMDDQACDEEHGGKTMAVMQEKVERLAESHRRLDELNPGKFKD